MVLFGALVLVKLALLVQLRRHLCEMHWRVEPASPNTLNWVAFYLFVGLGVVSLWGLARQCRAAGINAVRSANAVVLALGLCFIFLTFRSGQNNYLYPIQTGVLSWSSLGPYLSLDLCFRPPYLAAWLLGYALTYYVLARVNREAWVLHLTTLCASAYALLCLRELAALRTELLVLDCLGAVMLVSGWRSPVSAGASLRARWLLAPAGWCAGFAVALCWLASGHEREPLRYFLMLLALGLVLFAVATALAQKHGYLAPWSNSLFFYFAGFLLLTNNYYPMSVNYNNALCLGLAFPHYFGGELLLLGLLGLGAALYCRLWPRASLRWLDVLALLLVALAFVDLRLSSIMGTRLDWDVVSFAMGPKVMWRMAGPYLPHAFIGLGLLAAAYALAVWIVQKRLRHRAAGAPVMESSWSGRYAVGCFVLLAVAGSLLARPDKAEGQASLRLAQSSPLWKRVANRPVNREEFLRSAKTLRLGEFAPATPNYAPADRRDLNVVLILLESCFNQHLSLFGGSEETQPLLSRYRDRMELFPNFFSSFAGSIQAEFATFSGLYPVRDYNEFTLRRVNVKSLFDVMRENGYSSSLFFSSLFDYAGFRDFLNQRGIDEMYDAHNMPGPRRGEQVSWGLREEDTLQAIQGQIRKYAAGRQRFFLTYIPAAPHYPYDAVPDRFRKFKTVRMGDYTPQYLNELLSMDWVMASILDQLKESGLLENTLVIITNDHGEKTGANGESIGHGWTLTPQLANTPLIILDPQRPGYRLNYAIGSQVDVLPTVLDLLRIPLPQGQLYQGRSLYASTEADGRAIYLNSYEQYGVVTQNRIVCGSRKADEGGAGAFARKVWEISNQGSKTVFTEAKGQPVAGGGICAFDSFQLNFLRNYSFYCEQVHRAKDPQLVATDATRR